MDDMKGFHQNRVQISSTNFSIIILHLGILEYIRMPLGIKNAPAMLTSAPLLSHPDFKIPFILYENHVIFGLGAEIHQMKIINGQKINGPVCYIFEQSRYS